MATNPAVRIDWDAGEATFEMGERLSTEHPLFKVDVLGDIKGHVASAYEDALEELNPGQSQLVQRANNQMRRVAAESLAGVTVTVAKALCNGHVAMELSDGRVMVLCSSEADVHLRLGGSMAEVENYANTEFPSSTYYTDEPTSEEMLLIKQQLGESAADTADRS